MKKAASLLLAAVFSITALSAATASAQTLTIQANPFGTGVGVSAPGLSIVYSDYGFYDDWGGYHAAGHRHYFAPGHHHYCKQCEKQYRKYLKEHQKAHRKAHKAHKHDNKHDNGKHKGHDYDAERRNGHGSSYGRPGGR